MTPMSITSLIIASVLTLLCGVLWLLVHKTLKTLDRSSAVQSGDLIWSETVFFLMFALGLVCVLINAGWYVFN